MAFDWSLVVGSLVGAAIGLGGDWSGRFGARRQAERARREHQEDADRDREIAREEDRRRGIEKRETRALQTILTNMATLPGVRQARERSDLTREAVVAFVRLGAYEGVHVLDSNLRIRISLGCDALDFALNDDLETFDLGECVYTVRHTFKTSIGARLRGEDEMPRGSDDWARLEVETRAAIMQWKQSMRRNGYSATSDIDEWPGAMYAEAAEGPGDQLPG